MYVGRKQPYLCQSRTVVLPGNVIIYSRGNNGMAILKRKPLCCYGDGLPLVAMEMKLPLCCYGHRYLLLYLKRHTLSL